LFQSKEPGHYNTLNTCAETLQFVIRRESRRLVFTFLDESGKLLTEEEILTLTKERRTAIDQAEQVLRSEITSYLQKIRLLERNRDKALSLLRRNWIEPLLDQIVNTLLDDLDRAFADRARLKYYLHSLKRDVLENLDTFRLP